MMFWLDYSKNFKNDKIKALFSISTETNEEELSRERFAKLANFNPLKLIVPIQTHSTNINLIKIPRLRIYGAGLERINIKQALTIPVLDPYVFLNISGIDIKLDFQIFSDRYIA